MFIVLFLALLSFMQLHQMNEERKRKNIELAKEALDA